MNVAYHAYKNYKMASSAETDEEKMSQVSAQEAAQARESLYSFVSMAYDKKRKVLFLGTTHRNGDILLEFNPQTGAFTSCGFGKTDIFCPGRDSKIHKGLTLDPDGEALYFGIASLSPLSDTIGKPGGAVVRYDIEKRAFTSLGRPILGDYIQGTCFDFHRGLAYLYTDRGNFGVYDMKNQKLRHLEAMQSAPHNGCIDSEGGVWGTHSPGMQGFFRYNPASDRFEFPKCVLPHANSAANIMYPGAGPVDGFINGGDGFLYVATPLGDFYRLDPRTSELMYLGKPFSDRRLPGVAIGDDGWIYLCGGKTRTSMLSRYSRKEQRFEYLGAVEHPDGTHLHYAHEIVVVDKTLFIAETDNPTRSGYLWECQV
ncbi:MAG: hypothetical protein KIS92_03905 [Planctomycetota bacterium]|nr:hypothetical protein [Planctomycetota bacterium]